MTFSMSAHDLRNQLATVLNRFSIGASALDEVQSWLLAHLQAILDSQDALAIEAANELDSDLVQLGEQLIDEATFFGRIETWLSRLQTISPDFVGQQEGMRITTDSSVSETIVRELNVPQPMNLDLRVSFVFGE